MKDKLTSRKFLLAVYAVTVAAILCWFGKIGAGEFATVTLASVGGYLTANWAQKKAA